MLEMCPAYTDTSTQMTAPRANSGINDQLVKLCPLARQTSFEFLKVNYLAVVKCFTVAYLFLQIYYITLILHSLSNCWQCNCKTFQC